MSMADHAQEADWRYEVARRAAQELTARWAAEDAAERDGGDDVVIDLRERFTSSETSSAESTVEV